MKLPANEFQLNYEDVLDEVKINRGNFYKIKEATFERHVVKHLRRLSLWVSPRIGKNGLPDRVMSCRGLFIGLEFKTNTGRLTDKQKRVMYRMKTSNVIHLVVRPKSVVEFFKTIKEIYEKGSIERHKKHWKRKQRAI